MPWDVFDTFAVRCTLVALLERFVAFLQRIALRFGRLPAFFMVRLKGNVISSIRHEPPEWLRFGLELTHGRRREPCARAFPRGRVSVHRCSFYCLPAAAPVYLAGRAPHELLPVAGKLRCTRRNNRR
jgi:hypothetical protein